MTSGFVIKLLLSLFAGSAWVIISTTVAEKISGKLGGIIAGLPSTAVVAFLFIGLTQGANAIETASMSLLIMSGFYSFFFISYLLLSKKNFSIALIGAFAVWFLSAFLVSIISISSLSRSFTIWLLISATSVWWTSKNITIRRDKIPDEITSSPIWFKSLLSGLIISGVVLISKIAGPSWGGIFATFPAVTTSTLLVTAKSGGLEFTRLVAKNNHVSIVITLGLFAIFSYHFIPNTGAVLGTILSYTTLLGVSLPFYNILKD